MFGINSIEIEDTYLRLDKDLANLFQTLDATLGKEQWLVFLSADHGAAHAIGFMQQRELPADYWSARGLVDSLNQLLSEKFRGGPLVLSIGNYQVNFDLNKINSLGLDYEAIKKASVEYLQRQPGISFAIDISKLGQVAAPEPLKTMINNSYYFKRSGAIQIILNPGWFESGRTGTGHGVWNPYDTHIPLIWYGWKIKPGRLNRKVNMSDIAPTLAALLHIQMGNGSTGQVIEEVVH